MRAWIDQGPHCFWFASYCGMWYDPKADYAVIEPVTTDCALMPPLPCGEEN